jgi:peptide/nickel transport system substrate-binding protein
MEHAEPVEAQADAAGIAVQDEHRAPGLLAADEPAMQAHALAGIEPRALRDAPLSNRPLSCGPYRIVAASTDQMVLVRNDASGFSPAWIDTVRVRTVSVEAALAGYREGAFDVLVDVPPAQVRTARQRPGTHVVALVGTSYLFVAWNLRDTRFADPVVRRAAAQAVDIDALMRRESLGQGDRARGPLTALRGFADTTQVLPHDPAAAIRALEAAGWVDSDGDGARDRRGAQLAFNLLAPQEDALRVAVARGVAHDLQAVGIRAEVRPVQLQVLLERLQSRSFEAFVGQWFPTPEVDLDPVWRADATDRFNFGGYVSHVTDSLLTSMQHEMPNPEREKLLSHFQAHVYADQPYLFLFQNPHFLVLGPQVRGADPNVVSPFWNLPAWWKAPVAR